MRVQALSAVGNQKVDVLYFDGQMFKVDTFSLQDGSRMSFTHTPKFKEWSDVKYDLWEGNGLTKSRDYKVFAYEPDRLSYTCNSKQDELD